MKRINNSLVLFPLYVFLAFAPYHSADAATTTIAHVQNSTLYCGRIISEYTNQHATVSAWWEIAASDHHTTAPLYAAVTLKHVQLQPTSCRGLSFTQTITCDLHTHSPLPEHININIAQNSGGYLYCTAYDR